MRAITYVDKVQSYLEPLNLTLDIKNTGISLSNFEILCVCSNYLQSGMWTLNTVPKSLDIKDTIRGVIDWLPEFTTLINLVHLGKEFRNSAMLSTFMYLLRYQPEYAKTIIPMVFNCTGIRSESSLMHICKIIMRKKDFRSQFSSSIPSKSWHCPEHAFACFLAHCISQDLNGKETGLQETYSMRQHASTTFKIPGTPWEAGAVGKFVTSVSLEQALEKISR